MNNTILEIDKLTKSFLAGTRFFFRPPGSVKAVDGVSLKVREAESFGLLGESGSGKTTVGKLVLKLYTPDSGAVRFKTNGAMKDIATLDSRGLKFFRSKSQMISQDPYESLNPRMTVFDIVSEPILIHRTADSEERKEMVVQMLKKAGVTPPEQYLFRYPHELSGGQRQRVSIARALILGPSFILADEPTSMLDVSIRAGIIRLLSELQSELKISYLFITHDFAVARYVCKKAAVMYAGKILETGYIEDIIREPLHPYTEALLEAVPVPGKKNKPASPEKSVEPYPENICSYYANCTRKDPSCRKKPHPELTAAGEERFAACHKL